MRVGNEDAGPVERADDPVGDGVRPVRGRRERLADGAAGELQAAQHRRDVRPRRRRRDARTADFRHCRDLRRQRVRARSRAGQEAETYNEERVDELHGDSLAAVFLGEGGAPGREERFGARVGRQHGRGDLARKGANVQDQAVLPETGRKLRNKGPVRNEGAYLASMKGRMSLVIARVPWMLICRISSISC